MFSKPVSLLAAIGLLSSGSGPSPGMTMYRARKVVCDACGWITTRCQPAGKATVACGRCGKSLREKRSTPTQGMIRSFIDRQLMGGR